MTNNKKPELPKQKTPIVDKLDDNKYLFNFDQLWVEKLPNGKEGESVRIWDSMILDTGNKGGQKQKILVCKKVEGKTYFYTMSKINFYKRFNFVKFL